MSQRTPRRCPPARHRRPPWAWISSSCTPARGHRAALNAARQRVRRALIGSAPGFSRCLQRESLAA
eukprot:scaffold75931_cov48-Phaeocystis_antarctica.AAC.2